MLITITRITRAPDEQAEKQKLSRRWPDYRYLSTLAALLLAFGVFACSDDVSEGTNNSEQHGNDVENVDDINDQEDIDELGDADDVDLVPTGEPVAVAGPDQTVAEGETVFFDGSGSYHEDSNFEIVTYEWEYHDIGVTTEGIEVDRVYTDIGVYQVTLTVTDEYGATDSDSLLVDVIEGSDPVGGKAGDGDFDSDDEWIMRPYDTDSPTTTTCGGNQVILEPRTCTIEIEAPSITKYCSHLGGDDVYIGEITGDNTFYLELQRRDQDSDFPALCPNGYYFHETIEAEFVSADRWEGTSNMGVIYNDDGEFCMTCDVPEHPITGERQ